MLQSMGLQRVGHDLATQQQQQQQQQPTLYGLLVPAHSRGSVCASRADHLGSPLKNHPQHPAPRAPSPDSGVDSSKQIVSE